MSTMEHKKQNDLLKFMDKFQSLLGSFSEFFSLFPLFLLDFLQSLQFYFCFSNFYFPTQKKPVLAYK